jgi:hypothetical protein
MSQDVRSKIAVVENKKHLSFFASTLPFVLEAGRAPSNLPAWPVNGGIFRNGLGWSHRRSMRIGDIFGLTRQKADTGASSDRMRLSKVGSTPSVGGL